MTYSDFTLESVRRTFGLAIYDRNLFDPLGSLEPTPLLREALASGVDLAFVSEKARSEFIVAPVLVACREFFHKKIHIFSGIRLDAEPERGLKGECDFIVAKTASSFALQGPLMVILEAKKNDIEEGFGQCAAQMLGARIYNEKDGKSMPFIYGCVTTGEAWQFLKLENSELILHPERLNLQDIDKILWLLVDCIKNVDRQHPSEAAA
jgi:hypothetical protein